MLIFLFNGMSGVDLDRLNNHIDRLNDLDQVSHVALNVHDPNFSIECYDNISRHSYKGAEAMSLYITFRKIKAPVQCEDSI